ncbi:GerMN domain-containing protein [Embleya scabrispora]|uniref:GerMN domain-containing protein n=1 Tax=Embleya scabrispora TaxID=159449 RepID=UPI000364A089|nr:GerMN domain-containing protein [Embleya scabrispora]MYS85509.1 hypothetical protein [Streptomyces sp. SID5474]
MTTARYRLPLATVALLAVGAGCGIPTTGPVEAGVPAEGIVSPAATGQPGSLYVYLVLNHRIRPALRTSLAGVTPQAAINLLLAGPSWEEARSGVTTALPPNIGPAKVSVQGVSIRIDLAGAAPLTGLALNQLVCTASTAGNRDTAAGLPPPVSVSTPTQRVQNQFCPDPTGN